MLLICASNQMTACVIKRLSDEQHCGALCSFYLLSHLCFGSHNLSVKPVADFIRGRWFKHQDILDLYSSGSEKEDFGRKHPGALFLIHITSLLSNPNMSGVALRWLEKQPSQPDVCKLH